MMLSMDRWNSDLVKPGGEGGRRVGHRQADGEHLEDGKSRQLALVWTSRRLSSC